MRFIYLKIYFLFPLLFLMGISVSCQSENQSITTEDSFKKYFEAGEKFDAEGDNAKAEESFIKAEEFATKSGNIRDLVSARLEIKQYYMQRKEFEKLEDLMLDSLKICKENADCRGREFQYSHLFSIYNNLRFIYVFDLKDGEKLKWLIKDVASNEKYFGSEQTEAKVCKYINEIAQTQFSFVSEEFNKKYRCEVDETVENNNGLVG